MIWGVSRDTSGEIVQSQLLNTSVKNVRNSDCSKEADRKVYQSGDDQKPQSSTCPHFIYLSYLYANSTQIVTHTYDAAGSASSIRVDIDCNHLYL